MHELRGVRRSVAGDVPQDLRPRDVDGAGGNFNTATRYVEVPRAGLHEHVEFDDAVRKGKAAASGADAASGDARGRTRDRVGDDDATVDDQDTGGVDTTAGRPGGVPLDDHPAEAG